MIIIFLYLIMENKSILITGGAGFIGSNIIKELLKYNVKLIRVLDNLSTGNINNIPTSEKIEFINGDINDINICRKYTKNIDIICHQAGFCSVPKSLKEPLECHDTNVNGFLNILLSAKEQGIKRIVYATSSAVYGDNNINPKKEECLGNLLSFYACSKYINEIYAELATRLYNLECIGLRYFNVFGPNQNPNGEYASVIPKFIQLINNNISPIIYGDGTATRDFIHIDNVVFANILAMTTNNTQCFGQVYNIGSNHSISIIQLTDVINNYFNKNIQPIFKQPRNGDIQHSLADINKAKNELNYKIITDFNTGINNTIPHFI